MSRECDQCGEHCLDCHCDKTQTHVAIEIKDLFDLIHWARRYCDGRATYAPSSFNQVYARIRSAYPDLVRCNDRMDETLMDNGAYWPYAQDGMYDPKTGKYDARYPNFEREQAL